MLTFEVLPGSVCGLRLFCSGFTVSNLRPRSTWENQCIHQDIAAPGNQVIFVLQLGVFEYGLNRVPKSFFETKIDVLKGWQYGSRSTQHILRVESPWHRSPCQMATSIRHKQVSVPTVTRPRCTKRGYEIDVVVLAHVFPFYEIPSPQLHNTLPFHAESIKSASVATSGLQLSCWVILVVIIYEKNKSKQFCTSELQVLYSRCINIQNWTKRFRFSNWAIQQHYAIFANACMCPFHKTHWV